MVGEIRYPSDDDRSPRQYLGGHAVRHVWRYALRSVGGQAKAGHAFEGGRLRRLFGQIGLHGLIPGRNECFLASVAHVELG